MRLIARRCAWLAVSAAGVAIVSPHAALAAWIPVAPFHQVRPEAITAVEIVTAGNIKEARVAVPSQQYVIRDSSSVMELEKLTMDVAVWMAGKAETGGGQSIKRYIRRAAILAVYFSCPSSNNCSARVDGTNDSFSRVPVDEAAAIADLKKSTGDVNEFTLLAEPTAGFGAYLRRSTIREVRFICSSQNNCSQADVVVPSASTRITRDAKGIAQLLLIVQ